MNQEPSIKFISQKTIGIFPAYGEAHCQTKEAWWGTTCIKIVSLSQIQWVSWPKLIKMDVGPSIVNDNIKDTIDKMEKKRKCLQEIDLIVADHTLR